MRDRSSDTDPDRTGLDAAEQRTAVRERYAEIAAGSSCCTGSDTATGSDTFTGTCSDSDTDSCGGSTDRANDLGYSEDDLDAVDAGADLNLGCGNPTAIASLDAGETVLDLGSGAGFDCFLAAKEVGPDGAVIGVDMTPEMVERARENVEKNDASNVEFRLGEIEHLPVRDGSVDVVISNCVVNLSPDKSAVFHEAYRVLRPGGRLAISDVVLAAEPPDDRRTDPASVAACTGDAAPIPELESMLTEAGFTDVSVEPKGESREFISEWGADSDPSDFLVAARIEAERPATDTDQEETG